MDRGWGESNPPAVVENLTRDREPWWKQSPDRRLLLVVLKGCMVIIKECNPYPGYQSLSIVPHPHPHMTVSLFSLSQAKRHCFSPRGFDSFCGELERAVCRSHCILFPCSTLSQTPNSKTVILLQGDTTWTWVLFPLPSPFFRVKTFSPPQLFH